MSLAQSIPSVQQQLPAQSAPISSTSFITTPCRNVLGYQNLTAKQLAVRLNVPRSWVLDNSNPRFCGDPIPYLSLGKHKRFLWGSPDLVAWIAGRIVCDYPIDSSRLQQHADYEYLDSAELAVRLNVATSWVRDQVRSRASDPIPHARFGRYVRFRRGSPELETWAEHRMLSVNNRMVGRANGKEMVQ
jgi:hypothetical protein